MERLNDEGQWIVLMGVVVAAGMFMLAIIINQAPMVGQSTSEAVLEFPKNEIQDIRYQLTPFAKMNATDYSKDRLLGDMQALSMDRNNAVVYFDLLETPYEDLSYKYNRLDIYYNNGMTTYDEKYTVPVRL